MQRLLGDTTACGAAAQWAAQGPSYLQYGFTLIPYTVRVKTVEGTGLCALVCGGLVCERSELRESCVRCTEDCTVRSCGLGARPSALRALSCVRRMC